MHDVTAARPSDLLDVDGTPEESALAQIAHLIHYEYRLKDHSPTLIVNTIEQVLDAYDKERAE